VRLACYLAAGVLAFAATARAADPPAPANPTPARVAVPAPGAAPAAREAEALRLLMLRMRHDNNQQFLQGLSDAQARHHALMMEIMRNVGRSGRYEYNPATGRYDRYVPYR
jgi:hypothetical protein